MDVSDIAITGSFGCASVMFNLRLMLMGRWCVPLRLVHCKSCGVGGGLDEPEHVKRVRRAAGLLKTVDRI